MAHTRRSGVSISDLLGVAPWAVILGVITLVSLRDTYIIGVIMISIGISAGLDTLVSEGVFFVFHTYIGFVTTVAATMMGMVLFMCDQNPSGASNSKTKRKTKRRRK